MKIIRVGVDLAKSVFQVHGVDRCEKVVWRKKLGRAEWLGALLEKIEPGCEIGMEACGGAYHWARQLQKRGFTVKLIAPQFVKPYVKSNKNDANDAEAICEAMSRPNMRFVAIKSVEQQDLLPDWLSMRGRKSSRSSAFLSNRFITPFTKHRQIFSLRRVKLK
jgi:transposase